MEGLHAFQLCKLCVEHDFGQGYKSYPRYRLDCYANRCLAARLILIWEYLLMLKNFGFEMWKLTDFFHGRELIDWVLTKFFSAQWTKDAMPDLGSVCINSSICAAPILYRSSNVSASNKGWREFANKRLKKRMRKNVLVAWKTAWLPCMRTEAIPRWTSRVR